MGEAVPLITYILFSHNLRWQTWWLFFLLCICCVYCWYKKVLVYPNLRQKKLLKIQKSTNRFDFNDSISLAFFFTNSKGPHHFDTSKIQFYFCIVKQILILLWINFSPCVMQFYQTSSFQIMGIQLTVFFIYIPK